MGGRALTSLMGYSIDGLIIDYWEVVETVGRQAVGETASHQGVSGRTRQAVSHPS